MDVQRLWELERERRELLRQFEIKELQAAREAGKVRVVKMTQRLNNQAEDRANLKRLKGF